MVQEYTLVDSAAGNPSGVLTLPARIKLESLADDRLRVKESIEVVLFETDGFILAEAVGFKEFGEGDNPAEALADLQEILADFYFFLAAEQQRLGKGFQEVWEILQTKVEPV